MVSPHFNDEVLKIRGEHEFSEEINIRYETLRRSVMILRAINHKLRQDIIKLLEEHCQMTVTDIYVKLRVEQSVASQHLAILRRAGILKTERSGKFIIYSLNRARLQEITTFMEEIVSTEA